MSNITKVVNLYKEPFDVYIGRAGQGQDGYFGNPYYITHHCRRCKQTHSTPESTLNCYEDYFNERILKDEKFRAKILELNGKVLGCFCKPKPCHGDIIVKWLEVNKINGNNDTIESAIENFLDDWEYLEYLQKNCPNKDNHEKLKPNEDGCLECGFYSK